MSWLLEGFADELSKIARTYTSPGGRSITVPTQRMESPAGPKPTRYRPAAPIRLPKPAAQPKPARTGKGRGASKPASTAPMNRGMAHQGGFGALATALRRRSQYGKGVETGKVVRPAAPTTIQGIKPKPPKSQVSMGPVRQVANPPRSQVSMGPVRQVANPQPRNAIAGKVQTGVVRPPKPAVN